MAAEQEVELKIPAPDPLGILEALTGGRFYDPIRSSLTSKTEKQGISVGFDGQVDRYLGHLYDAYKVAPCNGCKSLVESAIVGAEVYRTMQAEGLTTDQLRADESKITAIKENVKRRLGAI
jgi:hypothetical protein